MGSSLPYKAARSPTDQPGLLGNPSLNRAKLPSPNKTPFCPFASCSYLSGNRALRVPKLQGLSLSPSATRRWSPYSNSVSELFCTPPQPPPPGHQLSEFIILDSATVGNSELGLQGKCSMKYGMRDGEGEPDGFKARGLEAQAPRSPPPPLKNSQLLIKSLAPSSGSPIRLCPRRSQALALHGQQSGDQPQAGIPYLIPLRSLPASSPSTGRSRSSLP